MYERDFRVKLIGSKNSFVFLSEKDSRQLDHEHMIRVSFGLNKQAFFSLGTTLSSLKDGELAMCTQTAKELGISRNDTVTVSTTHNVSSVKSLNVLTANRNDYEMLALLADTVQETLLTQVKIVYDEQKLVIWLTNTLHVTVEVDGVAPRSPGKLELLTEVSILPPENTLRTSMTQSEASQTIEKLSNASIFDVNRYARLSLRLHPIDAILSLVPDDKQSFLLQPFTVFVSRKTFQHLRCGYDKCADFDNNLNVILGDLSLTPMPPDAILNESHETPDLITVRILSIQVPENWEKMPVLYAAKAIFECFHAKTGAKVSLETKEFVGNRFTPISLEILTTRKFFSSADELVRNFLYQSCMDGHKIVVNSNVTMQAANECRFQLRFTPEKTRFLVVDADLIRQVKFTMFDGEFVDLKTLPEKSDNIANVIFMDCCNYQQIVDDIVQRLDKSSTSLILTGKTGSGKTCLLMKLQEKLRDEVHYIYCENVACRTIKGKSLDSLLKYFHAVFLRLVYYQPSLLVLDDLQTICECVIDGEQPTQEHLQSKRISMILAEELQQLLDRNEISLIASCDSVSNLNRSIYSGRGNHLFKTVVNIHEFNKTDRVKILKHFFAMQDANCDNVDLDVLGRKTESFLMQDLSDISAKIVFESYKDCTTDCGELQVIVEQKHCEAALSQSSMLALRQVQLQSVDDKDFSYIGGLHDVKKVLIETMLWPAKYPNIFANAPLRLQSGVLLYGPPGTGKTLLAGASAKQCNLRMIAVKGPELLSKYIGASEQAVRDIFQKAQAIRPCILFFDEFDSLAPRRGHDNTGVTDRVVNQFLTQLDGVETLTGVCVLAATSRPDLLDPALLRPGRIDKQMFCPMPDMKSRLEILQALSKHLNLAPKINLQALSESTEGFSGADLQAVLYTAQMNSVEHLLDGAASTGSNMNDVEINQKHIDAALKSTRPSLSHQERLKYQLIYSKFEGKADVLESVKSVKQKVTLA